MPQGARCLPTTEHTLHELRFSSTMHCPDVRARELTASSLHDRSFGSPKKSLGLRHQRVTQMRPKSSLRIPTVKTPPEHSCAMTVSCPTQRNQAQTLTIRSGARQLGTWFSRVVSNYGAKMRSPSGQSTTVTQMRRDEKTQTQPARHLREHNCGVTATIQVQ